MLQMQTLLGNSDQDISAHRNPDLRLDGVLAGAQECLDAQVLLDPLEEQLHFPALTVKVGNKFGVERKVVGQKRNALAQLVFDHHPAQRCWIVFAGVEHCEHTDLVAHDMGGAAIDGPGVAPLELCVALGASYKEALGLMNNVQPLEVQIPPVEQVKRSSLDHQIVQHIDLVGLAIGDVNKAGNTAMQVQQSVQFDSGLGRAERCPRVQRQTQIDSCGIERVDRGVQIDAQRLLGIQRSGHANQMLGKVGIDLPRPGCIRVSQRVARNCGAAKPHVVQAPGLCTQIDLYVAQGLPVGQLGKSHGEELIQTGEVFDLEVAPMLGYAAAKSAHGQKGHELGENELALVHSDPSRQRAKGRKCGVQRSNRDQTKTPNSASKSLTYKALM